MLLQGGVGLPTDGLGDGGGVRLPLGERPVALGDGLDRPGLAPPLQEASDPGGADAVLGGDLGVGHAVVAVGQDALAEVGGVGLHGGPRGGCVATSYPKDRVPCYTNTNLALA
jgi:hypothetical protein